MNHFVQPVRPLRIVRRLKDNTHVTLHVFAVRVSNDIVEYLTIDGYFYENKLVAFAESYIDGEWVHVQ